MKILNHIVQNPCLALFRTGWKFSEKDEKKLFVSTYVLFFVANCLSALLPILLGWYVNALQEGHNILRDTARYAGLYLAIILVQWSIYGPARLKERNLAFRVGQNYLSHLFSNLLTKDLNWHSEIHSGSVNNRLRKSYLALRSFLENGNSYFRVLCDFTTSIIVMIYLSPLFGCIGVVLGLISVMVNFKFDKPFMKALDESNEAEHKLMAGLSDNLANIRTIITLQLERTIHVWVVQRIRNMLAPFTKFTRINEWRWFTINMMVNVTYIVVLGGYVFDHYDEGEVFFIGGFITLIGFVGNFTDTFYTITLRYTEVIRHYSDVSAVDQFSDVSQAKGATLNKIENNETWQDISIAKLQFRRNGLNSIKEETLNRSDLSSIKLKVRRGAKIAIIGESGAGKSTLLSVLRGLYEPTEYELTIDGQQRGWPQLSSMTMLIPQDFEVFENTIRYNLTLGLSFSENEIQEVGRLTCFNEVLSKLPVGIDTPINEKGVNLSGGERQRLALARGLLAVQDRSIILMDEPTSNIDTKTELRIFSNLFTSLSSKTFICSVHSHALLPLFDQVYQMSDGKLSEILSHAPLRSI